MPWTAADLERLLKPRRGHRAHYPGGHEHPQKNHGGGGGEIDGGGIPQGMGAMNRTPEEISADASYIDGKWKPITTRDISLDDRPPAAALMRAEIDATQKLYDREMAQADKLYVAGADLDEYIVGRARAIAQAPIAIRMPIEALDGVLSDGRVRNQFETDTSGGVLNYRLRAIEESVSMNVRADSPPEARPVYGYLDSDLTHGDAICKFYGDAKLTLKPEVSSRATMLFGDSLTMAGTPIPVAKVAAGEATVADIAHSGEFIFTSAGAASVHGPDPKTPYNGYVETQIWGGVRPADVAKVSLTTRYEPTPAEDRLVKVLGGRPIEYEILSPGGEVMRRGRGDRPPSRRSAATVLAW